MSDQEFAPIDEAPAENDMRFQLLLDTLPFIAFMIAPSGEAQHYNRVFIDYHGFIPGPGITSRNALLHPDDESQLIAGRQGGALSRRDYIVEARLRRHDGAYRWHRIHNKPLIQDGKVTGWLGTAIDIHDVVHANEVLEQRVQERTAALEMLNRHLTAEIHQRQQTEEGLRASEARYRMLYNRTPMALHSTNAEARLIDVNDTWLAMFEYERADVIGRCPAEFMTADSAERYHQQSWPEMLSSGGALRVVDYQFLTRSGRLFDGRLAAVGEFDVEGRFIRTWSATADVTAEKRADRDLRQAQRMEAVGQLTAGIAHDFNNLLTAILGNLELMAKKPPGNKDRAERLIAGAKSAAERGAKLTAQLLAFSRQQKITAEPVDLNMVLRGMEALLRSTIGGSVGITVRTTKGLPTALADPTQLELAILNLAINARDAMPHGGSITIDTAAVTRDEPVWPEEPAAGDYVAVRVADTGTGISDAVRERMFEPFFTTKGVGRGSGLGLPQVLGVVKQLGGGLSVCSALGDGTCITIFLPRAEEASTDFAEEPAIAAAETTPGVGVHILLVDDDSDVRMITAAMLSDAGYEVVEALSGASALDMLERADRPTALVLADIAMPGINGMEFAAIVRRSWPDLPVLLMTGYGDSDLPQRGTEKAVLRKPFNASVLKARVERELNRSRSGRN